MIYFIQQGEKEEIKIGYSSNPDNRIRSLQTSNPKSLRILGYMAGDKSTEADLHRKFQQYHSRGEWFNPSEEIFSYISQNCQNGIINIVKVKEDGINQILFAKPYFLDQSSSNTLILRCGFFRDLRPLLNIEYNPDKVFLLGFEGKPSTLLMFLEDVELDPKILEEFKFCLSIPEG